MIKICTSEKILDPIQKIGAAQEGYVSGGLGSWILKKINQIFDDFWGILKFIGYDIKR